MEAPDLGKQLQKDDTHASVAAEQGAFEKGSAMREQRRMAKTNSTRKRGSHTEEVQEHDCTEKVEMQQKEIAPPHSLAPPPGLPPPPELSEVIESAPKTIERPHFLPAEESQTQETSPTAQASDGTRQETLLERGKNWLSCLKPCCKHRAAPPAQIVQVGQKESMKRVEQKESVQQVDQTAGVKRDQWQENQRPPWESTKHNRGGNVVWSGPLLNCYYDDWDTGDPRSGPGWFQPSPEYSKMIEYMEERLAKMGEAALAKQTPRNDVSAPQGHGPNVEGKDIEPAVTSAKVSATDERRYETVQTGGRGRARRATSKEVLSSEEISTLRELWPIYKGSKDFPESGKVEKDMAILFDKPWSVEYTPEHFKEWLLEITESQPWLGEASDSELLRLLAWITGPDFANARIGDVWERIHTDRAWHGIQTVALVASTCGV